MESVRFEGVGVGVEREAFSLSLPSLSPSLSLSVSPSNARVGQHGDHGDGVEVLGRVCFAGVRGVREGGG